MRKMLKLAGLPIILSVVLFACKKSVNEPTPIQQEEVSSEVLAKIKAMGLRTDGVQKIGDKYLVEGDIFLSDEDINVKKDGNFLKVGDEEQYHTYNLVTGLPRTITISLSGSISTVAKYINMVDAAIARYNAQGLLINFVRVASGGNIVVSPAPAGSGYLASAGFPTAAGNPYNSILVNRAYLDTWNINTCTSIIAHEVGHCIGFRHTDYANRQYSCGGPVQVEPVNPYGAVHIPGTPVPYNGDPTSFMLACIGNNVNRPFNANDVTALNYLY